ncbi:MAG: manganese efflux pump, partial [bacterium]
MTLITVLLISIGLAMDAFAVSMGLGIKTSNNKLRVALKASLMFGLFQSLMPILGWFIGAQFKELITSYDHWIAFSLLVFIGLKMLYESTKVSKECDIKNRPDTFL